MAENFYTILTNKGKQKLAIATISGVKLGLTTFILGDGGGGYYEPTEEQTAVKKEVWRTQINNVSIDEENPSWINVNVVIPATVGGFTIREAGILDEEGDLIAIGKYPETYKPVIAEGSAKDLTVNMILEVSNAESVKIEVDSSVVYAKKSDLENLEKNVNAQIGGLATNKDTAQKGWILSSNGDGTSKFVQTTAQEVTVYGVKIDKENSNPETAVEYTDMAVGFNPARGNNGNFDFGNWQDKFPFNAIKPCLYKAGAVNYYLNPNDYAQKIDGGASDITSGNDGDVMVEFPKVYWKIFEDNRYTYVKITDRKIDDTWQCLAHMKGTQEVGKVYIAAYLGTDVGDKLRSLSGKDVLTDITIGTARTKAQGNSMEQMDYYSLLMLQVLYVVMFKNLDSQTALGKGFADGGNSAKVQTGATDKKGLFFGEDTGKLQNKFCGIEDFFGNCYYWIDGLFCNSDYHVLIGAQSFNDTGIGYEDLGQRVTENTSGYISSVQGDSKCGFIIKGKEGSSSTYYADYGSLSAGSLPAFGGDWSAGASAGAFRLSVANSASDSYGIVAARLCVKK